MSYEISKEHWQVCQICGKTLEDLKKTYGGGGIYLKQVFERHISKEHDINLDHYFKINCSMTPPKCSCGICNQECTVTKRRAKMVWNQWMCGRYEGQEEWSKKAKETRKGAGNPMFGKPAWNRNLTKDTSPILKAIGDARKGQRFTEEHKAKLSAFQSTRTKEPHFGCKHSEETKAKGRERTLKMIKDGKFAQTKSKPHQAFLNKLEELNIKFEEEKRLDVWSFDFYLIEYDIYVEIDGDYFHSNPKIYPNGPKTKTQKINYYRDCKKNKFCEENNIRLIRIWECDVLSDNYDIEDIVCKLKKSSE